MSSDDDNMHVRMITVPAVVNIIVMMIFKD